MKISIIAVGTKMPQWVEMGYMEYAKRLPREIKVEMVEIPLGARGKNTSPEKAMQQEAEKIRAAIPTNDWVVTLEVKGKPWSTEVLAEQLGQWKMDGRNISLLIGGPNGLHASCLSLSNARWSLSPLTLPHPLVRILLIEQIYRATTILNNHPYHK
ncbi:23S rRNA (pseudouridine(1915)-N(3))-methyltransferase RlmH [Marinibactrum halimedae]|uniref:Ribosomal RNA large subunit methyltransferase H n=1 Tax=Marinibactrum halimedae TaxID=1444977 RepID=A0AA37T4V2_9GAMM|nr:23S rRNA (pseudouridine(1915)-N(3))-methyltransferase RlmH [Marinibactrum halimedae]MCD9458961.1 23S rRNA (pseudouridine(1915)-N(3))-methyltransferase RlmH [Marinibactrum halimedae]GLS26910.1 ribosomal RNA large subunit methyltransferase H [Marinibactrum halimedae]